jgi:hypothetical protein
MAMNSLISNVALMASPPVYRLVKVSNTSATGYLLARFGITKDDIPLVRLSIVSLAVSST